MPTAVNGTCALLNNNSQLSIDVPNLNLLIPDTPVGDVTVTRVSGTLNCVP
jgi:hypothetical protein